jgi:hypothetical protein
MSNYHIEYDDGAMADINASDAGSAINRALYANRGHRVKRCFQGGLAQDPRWAGKVEFDVPPHQAAEVITSSTPVTIKMPSRNEAFAFYKSMENNTREVKS